MTPKQLSQAIRKGHMMIGETRSFYYSGKCGCAIGAAVAAIGVTHEGWIEAKVEHGSGVHGRKTAAALLHAPYELISAISFKHSAGTPRLEIADWLDTLPDETPMPPKVERESDADYATRMLRQITKPRAELLTVESKS